MMKPIIVLMIIITLALVGCETEVPISKQVTGESVDKVQANKAQVGKVQTCEDLECFQEKFRKCEQAMLQSELLENLIYYYEIIGQQESKCAVKSRFIENPNPEWVGPEMVCGYDSSLDFSAAVEDFSNCQGELYDLFSGANEPIAKTVGIQCEDNKECPQGKKCIGKQCRTVESLYDLNCEAKCNFKRATLRTSAGETVVLKRGESTYAYAGALQYNLLSGPDYCPGSAIVPIQIGKVTTGKVLNTQVITLTKGEKSESLTHPKISRINFTIEVNDIAEECQ
jgi:hypothetical protein